MLNQPRRGARWTVAVLFLAVALAACRGSDDVGIASITPGPGVDEPPEVVTATTGPALADARPPTAAPSPSATPASTETPAPSPTPRPSSAPSPSPSPSPVRSPSPTPTAPSQSSPTPEPCSVDAARRRVGPSVVQVVNDRGDGRVTAASGYAVSGERIVTNEHVVNGAVALAVIRADGRRLPARIVRADEGRDLALLDAPGAALPAVRFGDAAPGQPLLAIGFPVSAGSAEPAVATGAIVRTISIGGATFLQTDLSAGVGYSGGPLLTICGDVVGTVSSGFAGPAGATFAVARAEVDAFLAGAPPLRPGGATATPGPPASPSPAVAPGATPTAAASAAPAPSGRPTPTR